VGAASFKSCDAMVIMREPRTNSLVVFYILHLLLHSQSNRSEQQVQSALI
jgi:hypothetical protein